MSDNPNPLLILAAALLNSTNNTDLAAAYQTEFTENPTNFIEKYKNLTNGNEIAKGALKTLANNHYRADLDKITPGTILESAIHINKIFSEMDGTIFDPDTATRCKQVTYDLLTNISKATPAELQKDINHFVGVAEIIKGLEEKPEFEGKFVELKNNIVKAHQSIVESTLNNNKTLDLSVEWDGNWDPEVPPLTYIKGYQGITTSVPEPMPTAPSTYYTMTSRPFSEKPVPETVKWPTAKELEAVEQPAPKELEAYFEKELEEWRKSQGSEEREKKILVTTRPHIPITTQTHGPQR